MPSCPSCRITTNRPKRAYARISAPSLNRRDYQSFYTTCRHERHAPSSHELVVRLAEIPQFIGLKDATGDITRPARLRSLVGPDFRLLSGDDATALAFFTQGGDGCISVTSNVAPALCRSMFPACKQGQMVRAQRLFEQIAQLTSALFRETKIRFHSNTL